MANLDENEEIPVRPSWITRDECIDRYQYDPTGVPEVVIKSKLSNAGRGRFQRVWLEDAIRDAAAKEKEP